MWTTPKGDRESPTDQELEEKFRTLAPLLSPSQNGPAGENDLEPGKTGELAPACPALPRIKTMNRRVRRGRGDHQIFMKYFACFLFSLEISAISACSAVDIFSSSTLYPREALVRVTPPSTGMITPVM